MWASWSGISWSVKRPGKAMRWSVAIDPDTAMRIAACSRRVSYVACQMPAAARRASTRSVRSQVKSGSSRPKWPYAAVWA